MTTSTFHAIVVIGALGLLALVIITLAVALSVVSKRADDREAFWIAEAEHRHFMDDVRFDWPRCVPGRSHVHHRPVVHARRGDQ